MLKNEIEVVQFQSNSPQYLPISEEFWEALAKLPSVYDYSAYRKILEKFGTHYISEGSLGGSFNAITAIDRETENYLGKDLQTVRLWNRKLQLAGSIRNQRVCQGLRHEKIFD